MAHLRRRVRKKKFDKCGHTGFGRYCHRCADADRYEVQSRTKKDLRGRKVSAEQAKIWEQYAKDLRCTAGKVTVSPVRLAL